MTPSQLNLALALEQVKKAQEDLWEVQIGEYPDSVRVELSELIELAAQAKPCGLTKEVERWRVTFESSFKSRLDMGIAQNEYEERLILRHREHLYQSIFIAAVQDPLGFFYKCGKGPGGKFRWVGYRYGLEPHQYMSGFEFF